MLRKPFSMVDVLLFFTVIFAVMIYGLIFVKAPAAIVLLSAGVVTIFIALIRGVSWKKLEQEMFSIMQKILLPALILLAVGMLIGAWMLSGTIPLIISYGLQILTPSTFLISTILICTVTSFLIGTSWGTIGTVGVALMGVSAGLGIPLEYAAAAIVTGTFFGDKLSPLSDSTIIASALTDVDLIEHIKHMLYTTVPGYVISFVIFFFLNNSITNNMDVQNNENISLITSTLGDSFNLNILLLIPPLIVLVLILLKISVLPVFTFGILSACLLAIFFQDSSLQIIGATLMNGYTSTSEVEIVDKMLKQGGLISMFETVMVFFASAVVSAPLKATGILDILVEKITKTMKSAKSMMISVLFVHGGFYSVTGNYSSSFAVMGPILSPLFDKYGVARKNLSRSLEDTGTAFGPGIPWGITAVFITNTLGVTVADYILLSPMIYTGVIFAIIYILTGYGIAYNKPTAIVIDQTNKNM
ncbi:Na+/H+ antiporter NhaC [Bacillus litorisediminis]|uniref:Na+/H+ antiporter NhaC n=1 Tax=Bacillus litorisediminis TaxID=2922713 RepID=UPI001FAB9F70|nr:Na+/H+ antiporter NhaC [Bacillus litorisediminis]